MLLKPIIYYDKIYLFAKNIHQEKYQSLVNELNKLAVKNKFSVDEIYEYSNSYKDFDELENELKWQKYVMIIFVIKTKIGSLSTLSKEDITIVVFYISVNHTIKPRRI